jgi:predicted nucleic acid-binding Zn ribbon protein
VPKGTCVADDCDCPVRCSDLCARHYKQALWRKHHPKPVITCVVCGIQFTATMRTAKYCTPRCRSILAAQEEKRARATIRQHWFCCWCGAEIAHMRSDAKYCSDYCSNRADWRDNRDRIVAGIKKYTEENHEKILAAGRKYREANREAIYARQNAWARANHERHRAYQRKYQRQYAIANPEKRRLNAANRDAQKRSNGGGALHISERDWYRILLSYGHRCAYCGAEPDERLQVEHIIPLARGGRHSIGNVVPACAACNCSKSDRLLMEWRMGKPRRVLTRRKANESTRSCSV